MKTPTPDKGSFSIKFTGSLPEKNREKGYVRKWFSGSNRSSTADRHIAVYDEDNNAGRQGPMQKIEYFLSVTSSIFSLDKDTGLITIMQPILDMEKKQAYIIDVQVEDDGIIFKKSSNVKNKSLHVKKISFCISNIC